MKELCSKESSFEPFSRQIRTVADKRGEYPEIRQALRRIRVKYVSDRDRVPRNLLISLSLPEI